MKLRKEIWSKNKVGKKYYAIRKGVVLSICQSWEDCSKMETLFKDTYQNSIINMNDLNLLCRNLDCTFFAIPFDPRFPSYHN